MKVSLLIIIMIGIEYEQVEERPTSTGDLTFWQCVALEQE